MFLLIGSLGSRERKIKAAFYLFIYTLIGSVLLLFSIIIIYLETGNTSFTLLSFNTFSFKKESVLWLLCYIAFSVKTPTFPLHIWLPEAHVEAPTVGSVILAGLLLKLGGYGFIKFLLPVFSQATIYYLPLVYTAALLSILYSSFAALRQLDLKRIIAYSSIAHMNLGVLGIFSCNIQGIQGGLFLMLAHGIVSSGLFFLVGVLYDKYHTRLIDYYGGLSQVMPLFSTYLFLLCLANIGVPGTCNFIGELLCFLGVLDTNFFVTIIALVGTVVSVLYTIFFYNRLIFGNLKVKYISTWHEITFREHAIVFPLVVLTYTFGIYPNIILDTTVCTVMLLVEVIQ
jgi:proton-translocating NADH-quinone oxidoreductase chain M